jgi:hypothetical protein
MLTNLAMLFLISTSVTTNTVSQYSYTIQEQSWISIAGSSNVNSFECFSNSNFTKGIIYVNTTENGNAIAFSEAQMALEIESFDCKNPILNKDMYKALGAHKNPNILIELLDAEFMHSEVQNPHSGDINVSATITINGNCQTMNFPIQWVRISGTDIRFVGSQNINMTDFDIKPPSPAFGLVKVNDLITINFHLIVQTNTSVFADGVNLGQP